MKWQFNEKWIGYATVGLIAVLLAYMLSLTRFVPSDFPVGKTFVINENESLRTISKRLKEENIITSALLFRAWVSLSNSDRRVQLGVYQFNQPLVLKDIVKRLVALGPDQPLAKVTIPEGFTTEDVIRAVVAVLPTLSPETLRKEVTKQGAQGKLFPSTYFLLPSTTEGKIVTMMVETFDGMYQKKFSNASQPSTLITRQEIISLASVIEGEAKTAEDMKIISGILQKRLAIGMPLQVDVAKETYKVKGVPTIPINNPGENALYAVFYPTVTPYLYYITGKDGTMYYAKTFEEHKRNISKYLR
jgi:UPF0755 protein